MTASQNADAAGTVGGAPTEYRINAHATSGGAAAANVGDTQIELDAGWGQEPSGLPGPAQLLAAAFAASLLKNLARAGELLGLSYDDAHVEGDRPPPGQPTEVHRDHLLPKSQYPRATTPGRAHPRQPAQIRHRIQHPRRSLRGTRHHASGRQRIRPGPGLTSGRPRIADRRTQCSTGIGAQSVARRTLDEPV